MERKETNKICSKRARDSINDNLCALHRYVPARLAIRGNSVAPSTSAAHVSPGYIEDRPIVLFRSDSDIISSSATFLCLPRSAKDNDVPETAVERPDINTEV